MARLRELYKDEIAVKLYEEGDFTNPMQVPKLSKVVLNIGVSATLDKDSIKTLVEELTRITGQKAIMIKARVSISNFKLREGMPIGMKVTLRGKKMYEFMDRLINVALPRIRDFRGVSEKAFDGRGNYSLGITDQTIFPEIDPDHIKLTKGMDIAIVTTAKTNDEAKALLKAFGMPFATA